MTRDSMVFYRSFMEGIAYLDEKDQLEAFWSIIRYALDGEEPDCSGPAKGIFCLAKPQIDANTARYKNGIKGGRPASEPEPNQNQTETKAEPNKNQTETKPKPKDNQRITKQKPNDNQTITKPEPNQNQTETKAEPNENENENVNVNVLKENTLKGVKEKRFAPPTREEVAAYCAEKGYKVDADRFVDFYESKGWYVGKNKMKNWQAAVRNWARGDKQDMAADPSQRQDMAAKGNKFHNFEQRDTDYNTLVLDRLRQRLDEAKGG